MKIRFKDVLKDVADTDTPVVDFLIAAFVVTVIVLVLIQFASKSLNDNKIADSPFYGGYSNVKLYQVYDRETGVYYLITEDGAVSPLYNADGSLRTVDNV